MATKVDGRRGAGSFLRALTGLAALTALLLAAFAGTASAKTVYDYVYSGTYIDGSGAGHTFGEQVGGLDYVPSTHQLYVAEKGMPSFITRLEESGPGVSFPGVGSPTLSMPGGPSYGEYNYSQVTVDQSGGPNDGNVYGASDESVTGFGADGSLLAEFPHGSENTCGIAPEPGGESILISDRSGLHHFSLTGKEIEPEDYAGSPGLQPNTKVKWAERGGICKEVFNNEGEMYGIKSNGGAFGGDHALIKMTPHGMERYWVNQYTNNSGVAIDRSDDDVFIIRKNGTFEAYDSEGRSLGGGWGAPDPGHSYLGLAGESEGIAVDPETNDVWVSNKRDYGSGVRHVEKFIPTNPHIIPDTTAISPEYPDPAGKTIVFRGTLNPDGEETEQCYFEYGATQELGSTAPCAQGSHFSGSSDQAVSSAPVPVSKGGRYWYRLVAANGNGQLAKSNSEAFIPQGKPILHLASVDRISTDGVRAGAEFDPNGGNASFHLEYGVKGGPLDQTTPETKTVGFVTNEKGVFNGEDLYEPGIYQQFILITGLTPDTTYEYRVVVTNEAGSTYSEPSEFTTYKPDSGTDSCPNALARQQSGSSLLLDCRGYELTSAPNAGGFDVESSTIAGQEPLTAYPDADGRLLYSVHDGVIPGVAGSPTNLGRDPYVAVRGPEGWTTEYVGLPADGMADPGTFGSPLLEADPSLHEFAFGGEHICDPCFSGGSGPSTNVPLRLADGSLVKGMAGSLEPAAEPAGEVRQDFSADGTHFVFGSARKFEPDGNEGSVSIYDRDLSSGQTQVVSTMPDGSTMSGTVAELAISADGSRILIGRKVGEDSAGNEYFDLYMHVGDDADSVPVVSTAHGVIFNGMTADGTQVLFTTSDQLADDSDQSPDLFRAVVSAADSSVDRVSTGIDGTGNTDACTPAGEWNVVSGGPNCGVVTFAGGAGIASESGAVFFLSPELLDGPDNGEAGQVNLYRADPGEAPRFIAVLDTSVGKPGPAIEHPLRSSNFTGTSLSSPGKLAVDEEGETVYVAEHGAGRISRFDLDGNPADFSAGAGSGTNHLPVSTIGSNSESQIAVDNGTESPLRGSLYVTSNGGSVSVYSPSGAQIGELTGFGEACGVAVDPKTGAVFVGDYSSGIWRFMPNSGSTPVSNANYTKTGVATSGLSPCNVGADEEGNAYGLGWSTGPLKRFGAGEFGAGPPSGSGSQVAGSANAIATEAGTSLLYVDTGSKVVTYDSSGSETGTIEDPVISSSTGVAVDAASGDIFVATSSGVAKFGTEFGPYEPITDPAVQHAVRRSAVHSYEDFQVTPDGRYAVFSSAVPATSFRSRGHTEIYRYDAQSESLACPSCNPTGGEPSFSTALTRTGLNLTDDGRVFFTTQESLALRDTNELTDAYEWENGQTQLISTGIGADDSALVTVNADGRDAYFFTRDVLTANDENGRALKIYDAREGGGFVHDPERKPCAASDECHGPSSEPPGPTNIITVTGAGKHATAAKPKPHCKKGSVKRHGKCVKKSPKKGKKHQKHHRGRRAGG